MQHIENELLKDIAFAPRFKNHIESMFIKWPQSPPGCVMWGVSVFQVRKAGAPGP